jgi:hypothetical protein
MSNLTPEQIREPFVLLAHALTDDGWFDCAGCAHDAICAALTELAAEQPERCDLVSELVREVAIRVGERYGKDVSMLRLTTH